MLKGCDAMSMDLSEMGNLPLSAGLVLFHALPLVLKFLKPRLQHGMILAFDDYYCWSSEVPSGERLALAETFGEHDPEWRLLPYIQFGWAGMSFVVESAKALTGSHNSHW